MEDGMGVFVKVLRIGGQIANKVENEYRNFSILKAKVSLFKYNGIGFGVGFEGKFAKMNCGLDKEDRRIKMHKEKRGRHREPMPMC